MHPSRISSTASPRFRAPSSVSGSTGMRTPTNSTTFKRVGLSRTAERPSRDSPDVAKQRARRLSGGAVKKIEKKLDSLMLKDKADSGKLQKTECKLMNTSEELEATVAELEQTRTQLSSCERKYAAALRKIEKLEADNSSQAKELEEIRRELSDRRRKSTARKTLQETQNMSLNSTITLDDDESDEKLELMLISKEREKVREMETQVKRANEMLEKERKDNASLVRDMAMAVRAAQRMTEEAEGELASIRKSNEPEETEKQWECLLSMHNGGTKRNALLEWCQQRLLPYPSIHVSNFSSDWSDGKAFSALVHSFRSDLLDRKDLLSPCKDLAVRLANQLDLPELNSTFFSSSFPDWNTVMETVFKLYLLTEKHAKE